MAEAEKLGVQETEVEIWRIPRIETETAGTETLGIHKIGPPQMQPRLVGDQETDVSVMETAEDAILGTREITAGCGVLLIEAKIPESKIDRSLETEEGDLGVLEVDTGIAEAKILGIPERAPGVQKALGAGTEVARVLEAEAASSEVPETDAEEAETLQAKERSESSVALRVVANLPESELLGTQKTEVGGTGISQREVREAETEIPKTQEISSEGSGVPDLEAKMEESGRKMEIWETPEVEKVNSELFGTQKGSETIPTSIWGNPESPNTRLPRPIIPHVNPQYNPQTPGRQPCTTQTSSPPTLPPLHRGLTSQPQPPELPPSGTKSSRLSEHPFPSQLSPDTVTYGLSASPSPSPVGYSPMTPGAPSPGGYNPHTPGSGIEQNSSDWVTTDIQVKVRDTYLDTQIVGQTGVIRSVTGGMCSVYLKDSEKVVSISSEHLEPITPTKNNKVKVILGEDREATGVLLSIDGEDGIIRMDLEDQQIKILNLRFLGKLLEA